MVGNASTATLYMLALHASITSSNQYDVVAEDASAVIERHQPDNSGWKSNRHHGRNLRRRRRRLLSTETASGGDAQSHLSSPKEEEATESTAIITSSQHRNLAPNKNCLWYPDRTSQDGCTNNPNMIPPEWLENDIMRNMMLHNDAKGCCDMFFQGKSCNHYPDNVNCGSGAAGGNNAGDAGAPTCATPGWYADTKYRDGCTNGESYIKDWLKQPMRSHMFFTSSDACCNQFFQGKNCVVRDEGCIIDSTIGLDVPVVEEANCEDEWHPDVKTKNGCTNDATDYPPAWKSSEKNKNMYFFTSERTCCERYHNNGVCQVRDACTSQNAISIITFTDSPTPSPTQYRECQWHPALSNTEGEMPTCVYSDKYPFPWLNPNWSSNYLFASHEECCLGAHKMVGCGKKLVCETEQPTLSPTTKEPSLSPTTPPPTQAPAPPTPYPSSSPTSTYYVQHFSGLCVKDSDIPKPYYIQETFTDYETCCTTSFKAEACLEAGPSDPPSSFVPTITPRPTSLEPTMEVLYYVEHFSGLCYEGNSMNIPHYIKEHERYTDFWTCCENSFAAEKCFKEGPTDEPTTKPSVAHSLEPSSAPSNVFSPEPSIRPSEPSKPTISPTTFYWGAYVAFTSKPTLRPTKQDCVDLYWHAYTDDQGKTGCTNYPVDSSETVARLLWQTPEECCASEHEGKECTVRDNCEVSNSVITDYLNFAQQENTCDNYWHPDITYGRDGCSNSLNFPNSWKTSKNRENLLYDSLDECCHKLYLVHGYHCKVYNHCSEQPPTNQPIRTPVSVESESKMMVAPAPTSTTTCKNAKWHIAVGLDHMACSNSLTYPEKWDEPTLTKKFLFDNWYECCNRYSYGQMSRCGRYDDCDKELAQAAVTTTPSTDLSTPNDDEGACIAARWHMTPDFSRCSNSVNFPIEWLEEESRYFFDTPAKCCLGVFNYKDCPQEDVCASSVSLTSSNPGTFSSTNEPIHAFTGEPTLEPTGATSQKLLFTKGPSQSPTLLIDEACSGKSNKQCTKDKRCKYDRVRGICSLIPEPTISQSEPAQESELIAIDTTGDPTPTSELCQGFSKKKCVKYSECIWDTAENSCHYPVQISTGIAVEKPDATATPTSSNPNCKTNDMKWHPKTVNDRVCSNSNEYPPLWDNPPYSEKYLFTSFKQCCKRFYNGQCNKEDVCDDFEAATN